MRPQRIINQHSHEWNFAKSFVKQQEEQQQRNHN